MFKDKNLKPNWNTLLKGDCNLTSGFCRGANGTEEGSGGGAFWGILDDVGAKRGGLQWEFREMDCSRVGASGFSAFVCFWPFPFLFLFCARQTSHRRTGFWLVIKGRRPLSGRGFLSLFLFIW